MSNVITEIYLLIYRGEKRWWFLAYGGWEVEKYQNRK
jgi:hypothetical protein